MSHGRHWSGTERHRPDEQAHETFAEKLDRLGIRASPETARAIARVDASGLALSGEDRLRVMALVAQAGQAAVDRPAPTFAEVAERNVPTQGSVYFIRHGQHIKIGFTARTPEQRLAGMQLPPGARVVAVIPDVPVARERALHRQFATSRVKGEWFASTPALEALIREHAK